MSSYIYGNKNYSMYAVPAAWVMTAAPFLYTLHTWGPLKDGPQRYFDQQEAKENLTKDEKFVLRAKAAHQDGIDNIPILALALLTGNYAKLPTSTLNRLAATYLISRVFYYIACINIDRDDVYPLRSVSYLSGTACCLTLFINSAHALYLDS
ncbi:Membrane-associated, eicosanoid/glutathione metabolism (MAPEG) protein [Phaffia rhodozyma]|uniref:Membrane-associated, eicosanoid/glutathione metabolism (MAPEG) protein n=1 Tax=Phaffia rhodozyma TaxID=264483 RepID=A0A0F7SKJ6_PHARH|nr:Membrane-associated, eicosanoid/glutathione metabolism (MAPEG) protein [Phaffia rhodozyma]CDZ97471.1 Membrane-associated, eicosanoid/glutathione metabolism (MAPEG) protein [Phaffia rhodozyma]